MGDFFEVRLPSKAKAGLVLLDLRDQMKLGVFRIVRYGISKAFGLCFSTGVPRLWATSPLESLGAVARGPNLYVSQPQSEAG